MIDVLNRWMLESITNFNAVVTFIVVLFLFSAIVLFIMIKKIGQSDERTKTIYFKVTSCMFKTQIIMNCIFISLVNNDIIYFRQIFILFEAIVFFVGAIYALRIYRKEFK
ncbi:6-aminohexanoate hydrolase [Bacillus sp. FSL K6-0273]|uniref:6-aminohexanoate hydrolase n=1 Tax=Bacillus TaxID=1386 RepID=UPI000BFAA3B4|nr:MULTISPECIES: 6-aminohexanoate hydrolase [Bacillus cereus group]MDF9468701.1 6-aminohexanoate hydrolase [Bacillus cereus]PFE93042.1 6-aminohexanoate hydrolase [Bacillus thuringiensis]